VVAACIDLLAGGDADGRIVTLLGGPQAMEVIHGEHRTDQSYWLRVWAARGLLWAWDDAALDAVCRAMSDDAWRVREMGCKVVARNRVEDALPAVAELQTDPVERVRRAAARAVVMLTEAGT
jgi:HEAT repeat protein